MDRAAVTFGSLLRQWRQQRGLTQLALGLDAQVSSRHLSWLESGKAEPSRAMVLRLAERLEVPLRERNTLLVAAGYAPLYGEHRLEALPAARGALQRLLDAHDPWPALVVDRHWNLVASNAVVPKLLRAVDRSLLAPPVNVLRLTLHPKGLAPMIEGLPRWRAHVLARLRRQAAAAADPTLSALHDELEAMPGGLDASEPEAPVVSFVLATPQGRLSFISTVTMFGAPHDITLAELAVETLLPADEPTAALLRAL